MSCLCDFSLTLYDFKVTNFFMWNWSRTVERMKKEGRTRAWLADQCGVTLNSLQAMLSGRRRPGRPVIKLMAIALRTTEEELLGEEEHSPITEKATG